MPMINQQLIKNSLWIALVVVVAALALPALAKPSVSWEPSKLQVTAVNASTSTVEVSFTAEKDLNDVVVRVVPELSPYVSVEPAELGDIERGSTHSLTLLLTVPPETEAQLLDGTIQLRQGTKPAKVYAKPLPVELELDRLPFAQTPSGLTVSYPERLRAVPAETLSEDKILFFENLERSHPPLMISEYPLRFTDVKKQIASEFAIAPSSLVQIDVSPLTFYYGEFSVGEPQPSRLWIADAKDGRVVMLLDSEHVLTEDEALYLLQSIASNYSN